MKITSGQSWGPKALHGQYTSFSTMCQPTLSSAGEGLQLGPDQKRVYLGVRETRNYGKNFSTPEAEVLLLDFTVNKGGAVSTWILITNFLLSLHCVPDTVLSN